jgi:glycogen operon protein
MAPSPLARADNETSWLDWEIGEREAALLAFTQKLTSLRHRYPVLRRTRFLTGEYDESLGVKDVTWINAAGREMQAEDWGDGVMRCFGMLLDGRAQPTGIHRRGQEATLLLVLNAHHDVVRFTLPACTGCKSWTVLVDTNRPVDDPQNEFEPGQAYDVTTRSLLLFAMVSDD